VCCTFVKNKQLMTEEKRRHFGGALYVPPDRDGERSPKNRIDKILQEKSLKSYLRGDRGFYYRGDWFSTLEKWS